MTVSEKDKVLNVTASRFESGAWDDLDVSLLMELARIAVSFGSLSPWTDDQFARVGELRSKRDQARQERANKLPNA